MKKTLRLLSLAALTIGLLGSCSKLNERIDNLEKKVDGIENNQIATIGQQIATINQSIADLETIRTNIQALMDAKTAISEDITKLKAADQTLEGKINDLKTYVDTELAKYATKDWANATFASLAKQTEIITDVEKLKTDLAGLDNKLDQAIANLDSSLKGWVNEQLSGYYTIAQVDAKIAGIQSDIEALEADNETNKSDIEKLEADLAKLTQDLATAKIEIKAAYEKAISDAINGNDGYINSTIKNAIDAANANITDLTGRVSALETTVAALSGDVDALKAMIQTVSIIPAYSNGSLKAEDGILTINCVITPKEAVDSLSKENFTILTSESEVLTKSALYGTLKIAKDEDLVLDTENGTATIKVDVSDVLPAEEDKALTVALNVKNGLSDFTTEFVAVTESNSPVYEMKYAKAVYSEEGGAHWEFTMRKTDGDSGYPVLIVKTESSYSGEFIEGEFKIASAIVKTSESESIEYTGGTVAITCTESGSQESAGKYCYAIKTENASGEDVELKTNELSTSASNAAGEAIVLKDKSASDPTRKAVESITFPDDYTPEVSAGSSAALTLKVTPEDATNPFAYWSSSDESVATVDAAGNVKGVGEGTAVITATSIDGKKSATCTVTVKAPAVFTLKAQDSGGSDLYFRNTHNCFSPDKKTAYIASQSGCLVAVDLVKNTVKWVWTTPEQQNDGCVQVACNPVSGDVYLRNKGLSAFDGFYAIKPDGTTKWKVSNIQPLGSCFAVSSDGNVVFACGTSKTIPNANNREFGAFSANDGSEIDRCYCRNGQGSHEGITSIGLYCNNAQMAVYKTDDTYDYIVLYANEILQFYTYDRTNGKFKWVNASQPNASWKSWADACSIGLAVGPDNKIFIPSNTQGVIMVIDGAATNPWENISWMKMNQYPTGIVFDTSGNMIIGTREGFIKVAKDKIAGGAKETPVNPTTEAVYVASIGKSVFTHAHPYISSSGDVYTAGNNADANLCGDIYCAPAASTGNCTPVEVYHSQTATYAQGCFCMTDGALIFPTATPAEIILKKDDKIKMPKTWCGYGGDPCASMNYAFAYGSK